MVILQIVAPAEFGGLERVVQGLARGLRRRGHDMHVAAVFDGARQQHPFLGALRASDVAVYPIELPRRAYLRERRATAALCRRLQPDVVHTHGYRPDVVDATAARRCGVPVVTTAHGFTAGGWKNRLYEAVQRRALRRFDLVVAVSRPLARLLARTGVRADRIEVLPNAWDGGTAVEARAAARRALGVPENCFHIGWVGRLTPEKGADVLVDALAHLTDIPMLASFVGDGPERARLEARGRALGLENRIVWRGVLPEAARFFRAFDVFVLSSRSEGTPIVIFEAIAAEVPIVATPVGGVPDVVSEAEALLTPPADPAALGGAIRGVFVNPGRARLRIEAASARLTREFSLEPWLERYEAVYRHVISPEAAAAARAAGHRT